MNIPPKYEDVVAQLEAALGREASLREELEMARDDLVIFKSAISAVGDASKKLVFCARTSGGAAGPDQGLMDACSGVEGVLTLFGVARAMDEFERLTSDFDALQQRLTVAEHQADEMAAKLGDAYEWGYGDGQNSPNGYSDKEDRDECVAAMLKPDKEGEGS